MWFARLSQGMTLGLIAFTFAAVVGLSNLLLGGWRLDLTEAGLYTLTDGTREVLAEIEEPITLHFFFSDSASEGQTGLRAYAGQVESMLEEYERAAGGMLALKVIDPEPFSEQEDMAAGFGLQPVPGRPGGQDNLYFGLAGSNAVDDVEIISVFQSDRQRYLEYDLSRLIYQLVNPGRPRVGVFAGLPVLGQPPSEESPEPVPAWTVADQLRELFALEAVDKVDLGILEYDLLLLVHPKELAGLDEEDPAEDADEEADEADAAAKEEAKEKAEQEALFALDQFLMKGGRLLAFVDPLADGGGGGPPEGDASSLNQLTAKLGITLRDGEALADAEAALQVNISTGGTMRHLGIQGFGKRHLSQEDLVTAPLEKLHFSTTGIFDVEAVDGITVENLVHSSAQAMPMPVQRFQFIRDPNAMYDGFAPTGEVYPVAVRVSGSAESQFPDGIDGYDGEVLASTDALQMVLVADTDVLTDRLWAQTQQFFGRKIVNPFADNGSFLVNLAENLSGSNALIKVRSRGQYSRPFDVVETLRRQAEDRYRQKEEELQGQLQETERQLSQIQASQLKDGKLTLTADQARALRQFQQDRVRIRKELREVRHQLDRDIESLGRFIKFLNIIALPLLLILLLIGWRWLRARLLASKAAPA